MIEIEINRDPREYKDKILAGLSLRQLICMTLLLCINIPLYIYGNKYLSKNIMGDLIIIISLPIILIGFFEYNKMPFEKVIWASIQTTFIRPAKRKYKKENVIKIIDDYIINEEIKNKEKSKKK